MLAEPLRGYSFQVPRTPRVELFFFGLGEAALLLQLPLPLLSQMRVTPLFWGPPSTKTADFPMPGKAFWGASCSSFSWWHPPATLLRPLGLSEGVFSRELSSLAPCISLSLISPPAPLFFLRRGTGGCSLVLDSSPGAVQDPGGSQGVPPSNCPLRQAPAPSASADHTPERASLPVQVLFKS